MGTEIQRALAAVRKVDSVCVHPNADKLELLKIGGWQVVSGKGNFKEDDLCVFFEIDSFVNPVGPLDFLAKNKIFYNGKEGARIKTIRLRGELSQGLAIPAREFASMTSSELLAGTDLTDTLGVVKWEKISPEERARLGGNVKGGFPSFIPKTDQERVQNIWGKFGMKGETFPISFLNEQTMETMYVDRPFKHFKDDCYEVSVKLDGSSMTVYWRDDQFGVCSRNQELSESAENAFWQVANYYHLKDRLSFLKRNIAIQGELIGPGVQGNRESLSQLRLFVFDVFDIDNQRYLGPQERRDCIDGLGLIYNYYPPIDHVPILTTDTLVNLQLNSCEDLLQFADGQSLNNPIREGIVFKCVEDPSFSFKVISNKFLEGEK